MFLTLFHCHIIIDQYQFQGPIYYVPGALHIFILPKFPHGIYYYSHIVDMFVISQTDAKDVTLFSLTQIHMTLGTPTQLEWQEIQSVIVEIILPVPPLGQQKGLKGLTSNRSFGGSPLVSSLHADHRSFAHFSHPHGILKASLFRLGPKLHRVQPPCEPSSHPLLSTESSLGSCQVRFLENSQEVKLCSAIRNFPQKGGLDTFLEWGRLKCNNNKRKQTRSKSIRHFATPLSEGRIS